MPLGVGSSFQVGDPYPIYLREGRGAQRVGRRRPRVRRHARRLRLDGRRSRAPEDHRGDRARDRHGSHFAAPTEDAVLFAEELCRRFNLEQVRFANSGTEATMSAIRVARAATGRDDIVKIEGSYHGHHDAVMFSVVPNADLMGGREAPASEPMSLGVPQYLRGHTHVVPFNDLTVLSKLLDERRRHDRVPDHRAGDDEHRHRRARARLPRRSARAAAPARRAAHLRRGEVGRDDRGRRRDRALRRAARPRLLRQGDRRRHARPPRSAAAPT